VAHQGDNVSEWRLIIENVRHKDAGVYHCQVTAMHSRRRSFDVRLHVKGMPTLVVMRSISSKESRSVLQSSDLDQSRTIIVITAVKAKRKKDSNIIIKNDSNIVKDT